ncbi:hypothetical protein [Rhizorhabdus sp.]|uniref:hypothetical protein n=1 Tax=Rhizorhabdus sp. TaxID=1968843 RepID=UPI0019AC0C89|nr:hypothetical protein [Rhizorhabdus sp.]MBD3762441.1 hypothetical protein [Rhizorhabdus sp.]
MSNAFLMRPLQWASITATSTASGYAAANLAPWPVPRMGRVWRSASVTGPILTIDLGSDQAFDTIALFGIGTGNAAPDPAWSWQIRIATDAQGPSFGAGLFWSSGSLSGMVSGTLPVSGRGKALWLAPAGAPATGRYVRIIFSSAAAAVFQVAMVAIGQRFQPARNYSFGAAFGVRDLGAIDYAPRGVVLRRPGAKLRGVGLTFSGLRREEVEDTLQRLFERVGTTDPVVLVTDPDAHPQRQNRMGIGHLTGNLGTIHRVPGAFQSEVNFVAVD